MALTRRILKASHVSACQDGDCRHLRNGFVVIEGNAIRLVGRSSGWGGIAKGDRAGRDMDRSTPASFPPIKA